MPPVFFIRGKVQPCLERSIFLNPGMMRRSLWTMYFLFTCITPPCCLFFLQHAVRSLVGRWSSELSVFLPIKFSCRVAINFSMSSISKNFLLNVSFAMRCYFTSATFMPSMRWILRCRNISILLGGICKSPRSHIPVGVYWWGWR